MAHKKKVIKGVEKLWEENEKKITKGEEGNQQNKTGYTAQDAPSTRPKITRDRRTYGPTDGRTDLRTYGRTDGHTLL